MSIQLFKGRIKYDPDIEFKSSVMYFIIDLKKKKKQLHFSAQWAGVLFAQPLPLLW